MHNNFSERVVDPDGYVRNEGDIQINPGGPYAISYGAIMPRASEATKLLVPACLSSSHIAYGSIFRRANDARQPQPGSGKGIRIGWL